MPTMDEILDYVRQAKNPIQTALAGIGDAYSASAGRSSNFLQQANDQQANERAMQLQAPQIARQRQIQSEMDDPTSSTSKSYQDLAAKFLGKDPETMRNVSGTSLTSMMPNLEKSYAVDSQLKERQMQAQLASDAKLQAAQTAADARRDVANIVASQNPYEKEFQRKSADKEIQRPKDLATLNYTKQKLDEMKDYVTQLLSHPGLGAGTGTSRFIGGLPISTNARDFQKKLDTLKSKVAFNTLQEMRKVSPTGGALGQVSDREENMLANAMDSLDISQSDEQFAANLKNIVKMIDNSKRNLDDAYSTTYDQSAQPSVQNGDKFTIGKKYNINGHMMTYAGNGEWE